MALFHDKVVAITGAASGIGLAVAQKLATQGALLSIADVNSDALSAIVPALSSLYSPRQQQLSIPDGSFTSPSSNSSTHGPILATPLDICDSEAVTAWIANTTAHFQRPLDAAANMAGIVGLSLGLPSGSIRNVSEAELARVLRVNLTGTWNCLRAELPVMRCSSSSSNGGNNGGGGSSIVNAASIAGLVGVENNAPYVMAKHAIVGLTKTAAKEEGGRNIRVNAIAPGIVDTPMVEGIKRAAGTTEQFGPGDPGALRRKGTSDEVANLVCFLLGGESSFVNGMVYGIDGGWIC